MSRIEKVLYGVHRDDLIAEVLYHIHLSDGRVLRISVPFNADLSDRDAVSGARPLAEAQVFRILKAEYETGIAACCSAMLPLHQEKCEAFI